MYRIHHRLARGKGRIIEPGSFSRLDWLKPDGLARLERKGAISRVQPPPLAVLPGWGSRARKIQEVSGIKDAEQLLEADTKKVAEEMGVKPETVKKWQKQIVGWLTAEPRVGGCSRCG